MYGWEKTIDKLSAQEELIVRALHIGIHYLLPYGLASQLWATFVGQFPWKLAIGAEAVFYVWMSGLVLPKLRAKTPLLEPCREPEKQNWMLSMDLAQAVSQLGYPIEKFISGWFRGEDMRKIPYGNYVSWASYMMYCREPSALEPACYKAVTEVVDEMCTRFDLKPPPGTDHDIRPITLFGEPLRIFQRSLLMYTVTSAVPRVAVSVIFMSVLGLRRECCKETGMYYWWRAPASKSGIPADTLPDLFFFHGLCGLTGYIPLIMAILLNSSSQGAVIFEIEDVSHSLTFSRQMTREAVVKTARSAHERLHTFRGGSRRGCIILGHSLGSCAAAQLLEKPPTTVAGVILIDPVCILLQLPNVAHGFLHRVPETIFDWTCFLFCATEPGIAQFFRRRFFWYNSWLKPLSIKDVPTLVCLSENDRLVPSSVVRAYVSQAMPHADVQWWERLDHTYFMLSPRCHWQLLKWIWNCSKVRDPLVPKLQPCMGG